MFLSPWNQMLFCLHVYCSVCYRGIHLHYIMVEHIWYMYNLHAHCLSSVGRELLLDKKTCTCALYFIPFYANQWQYFPTYLGFRNWISKQKPSYLQQKQLFLNFSNKFLRIVLLAQICSLKFAVHLLVHFTWCTGTCSVAPGGTCNCWCVPYIELLIIESLRKGTFHLLYLIEICFC